MRTKTNLKIDWATHEAVKFACENWHYSKCLPAGTLVKIGAWEDSKYIGCVIFGHGAIHEIGSPYGLTQFECVELVRVALTRHKTPVSKVMAFALRFLKKQCPRLRLVTSYADPVQGHHGGIYQATNWIYEGTIGEETYLKMNGKIVHRRSVGAKYGTSSVPKLNARGIKCESVKLPPKHKYLMPLDDEMRKKIEPLRKPYPKRAGSIVADAAGFQSVEGGSIPTPAIQTSEASNG